MTPPRIDRDVAGARLRVLEDSLTHLEGLRGAGPDQLEENPLERAAGERLLQVVVDLAVDINSHLAVALGQPAPLTGRDSFAAAGEIGLIDRALAERLAPSAGLRNVLVHRYVDIRVDLVASAIEQALDDYREYVRQAARFLRDLPG